MEDMMTRKKVDGIGPVHWFDTNDTKNSNFHVRIKFSCNSERTYQINWRSWTWSDGSKSVFERLRHVSSDCSRSACCSCSILARGDRVAITAMVCCRWVNLTWWVMHDITLDHCYFCIWRRYQLRMDRNGSTTPEKSKDDFEKSWYKVIRSKKR